MARKLVGILLLAALAALVPARAHGAISRSTLKKVNGLLKATGLDDNRDKAMSEIEELARSLKSGSCLGTYSPKHVLEMLVEVYKANKANEARGPNTANMDCSGETDSIARTLYEAMAEVFHREGYQIFVDYTEAVLREYARICSHFTIAELQSSISSLNGTIIDRIRTIGQYAQKKYDFMYAQSVYNYMLNQTSKEQDPDKRYLKLVVDTSKQKATANVQKIGDLRNKYVIETCKIYFNKAKSAVSRVSWASDMVDLTDIRLPEKLNEIYAEVSVYSKSYKVCKQALRRPYISLGAILNLIDAMESL